MENLPGPRFQAGISKPKPAAPGTGEAVNTDPSHITLAGVVAAAESPGAVRYVNPDVVPGLGGPPAGAIPAIVDGCISEEAVASLPLVECQCCCAIRWQPLPTHQGRRRRLFHAAEEKQR